MEAVGEAACWPHPTNGRTRAARAEVRATAARAAAAARMVMARVLMTKMAAGQEVETVGGVEGAVKTAVAALEARAALVAEMVATAAI